LVGSCSISGRGVRLRRDFSGKGRRNEDRRQATRRDSVRYSSSGGTSKWKSLVKERKVGGGTWDLDSNFVVRSRTKSKAWQGVRSLSSTRGGRTGWRKARGTELGEWVATEAWRHAWIGVCGGREGSGESTGEGNGNNGNSLLNG